NATTYDALVGGNCGIFLREIEEGRGELTLFFNNVASEETRAQFEQFVKTHLQRRALPETIHRRRLFVCTGCNTPITELQAKRRQDRGFDWLECNVCDERIYLRDRREHPQHRQGSFVPEMDRAADARRESEAAASVLQGKIMTADFDVFLCHNSEDK